MQFASANYALGNQHPFRYIEIEGVPNIPDGAYKFIDCYCIEPSCDCRKTIIEVFHNGEHISNINFGWESFKFYKNWGRGDIETARNMIGWIPDPMFNHKINPDLLIDFLKTLMDDRWLSKIKSTYHDFRSRITTQHNILKEQTSNKSPSRNSPCPCGSGKKYKRCCIN